MPPTIDVKTAASLLQKAGFQNPIADFSKIEVGKTTLNLNDVDLYQLLDELEDMLHLRAVNAGLELIFDRDDNLPRYIYTDGLKLSQVLLNLLGNAIKFTQKGEVILRVRCDFANTMYALNVFVSFLPFMSEHKWSYQWYRQFTTRNGWER
jgi:signal transduction histidine kinase